MSYRALRRRRKDEPHNFERWVVSYADMVTLLFAVFVMLFAMAEPDRRKLEKLKKSLRFAFHFEGHGKTYQDGIHERGDVGGDLLEAAMIVNPQKGPMREFLMETLPQEFEEITGRSIDLELQNDSIRFSGPSAGFFLPESARLRPEVQPWLTQLVESAYTVASVIRIHMEAPRLPIGQESDGTPVWARDLCMARLAHLQDMVSLMSTVMHSHVTVQFDYSDTPAPQTAGWEERATLTMYFSNN